MWRKKGEVGVWMGRLKRVIERGRGGLGRRDRGTVVWGGRGEQVREGEGERTKEGYPHSLCPSRGERDGA